MKLYRIEDAKKVMDNLNDDQARWWVRQANKFYQDLKRLDGREQFCRQRAVRRACEEVIRRYGKTR